MSGGRIDNLPMPKPEHDVRLLLVPSADKAGFETLAEATAERNSRIKLLESARVVSSALIPAIHRESLLRDLRNDFPVSLGNPHVRRLMRIKLIGATYKLVQETNYECRMVSIVLLRFVVKPENLLQFDFSSLENYLRNKIARTGGDGWKNGWMINHIDVEYNVEADALSVHLHGIAAGEKIDFLKHMTKEWNLEQKLIARPLVTGKYHPNIREISYTQKSIWGYRYSYDRDGRARGSAKGGRIPEPHHCLGLIKQHMCGWRDMVHLYGLEATKNGLIAKVKEPKRAFPTSVDFESLSSFHKRRGERGI